MREQKKHLKISLSAAANNIMSSTTCSTKTDQLNKITYEQILFSVHWVVGSKRVLFIILLYYIVLDVCVSVSVYCI